MEKSAKTTTESSSSSDPYDRKTKQNTFFFSDEHTSYSYRGIQNTAPTATPGSARSRGQTFVNFAGRPPATARYVLSTHEYSELASQARTAKRSFRGEAEAEGYHGGVRRRLPEEKTKGEGVQWPLPESDARRGRLPLFPLVAVVVVFLFLSSRPLATRPHHGRCSCSLRI